MRITVLNGSPKGTTSVTLQYVHYVQKIFPEHALNIINIGQRIRKIEKDQTLLEEILSEIASSDGVLWVSPVYFYLIPANYKRFIELIFEKGLEKAFKEKYAAFLSTSVHFFDHTAHNYMNAVCDDLNMRYLGSFSADMHDLTKPTEKDRLRFFAESFFDSIRETAVTQKNYPPLRPFDFEYLPSGEKKRVEAQGKKVLVLSDSSDRNTNLARMIEQFKAAFVDTVETVSLDDLDIKGACLGCIHCGYDNRCVYEGKDGYNDFFNEQVKGADILVFAGSIKDRYLSAKWKTFFDRSFFLGHAPKFLGKQIGFIISGPFKQIPNLRQVLEAYVETEDANLAGFVTDEELDSAKIDRLLETMGLRLVRFAENNYHKPKTFLSVAGGKVFRDEIWGRLRFPFKADHLVYRNLGRYDFPQKNYKSRIGNRLLFLLSRIPKIRKEIYHNMKEEMIKPLQKAINK